MMISDQINTISSLKSINSWEELYDHIDAYPVITNNLTSNYYSSLTHLETQDKSCIYQSNMNEQMQQDTLSSPHMSTRNSNTSSTIPVDFHDEIFFNIKDWQIKDAVTRKKRPPKLYEFLHLLLNNSCYLSYASWLNKDEGLFRLHNPTKVTELWKKVKARQMGRNMNYDNFSRGIRTYYHNGTMIATYTKHTYRFAVNK